MTIRPSFETQMNAPGSEYLRFDGFVLDTSRARLLLNGRPIPITAQPFVALAFLVRNAGRIVSRDELREVIWGDRIVEFETGLNFCMHQIRRALGDNPRRPRYVRTIPRAGYEFMGVVQPAKRAPQPERGGPRPRLRLVAAPA